jgi:hypothetical protein
MVLIDFGERLAIAFVSPIRKLDIEGMDQAWHRLYPHQYAMRAKDDVRWRIDGV